MYPEYAKLCFSERGNLIEEEHYGLLLEYSPSKTINIAGNDNGYLFYHRSCMKPMQLVAIKDIIDEFSFSDEEIAVCYASHTGEDFHLEAIRNILRKIGLSEKDLLCPPIMPLSKNVQAKLIENNKKPLAIHNNCSGKHAAMLAYCVLKNYDIKKYTDIEHPLQKHIIDFVERICGVKNSPITKDGCTLPVIATPLENLAKGFLEVWTNPKYKKIQKAVLEKPYFAGGFGRLDSEITSNGNKNLAAKVGAGNICCVADLKENKCWVIKLADSDNFARGVIMSQFLQNRGKLIKSLEEYFPVCITDETGFSLGKINLCY